jgi:hypothetical protein
VFLCWTCRPGLSMGAGAGADSSLSLSAPAVEDILKTAMCVSDSVALKLHLLWMHCVATGVFCDVLSVSNCMAEVRHNLLESSAGLSEPKCQSANPSLGGVALGAREQRERDLCLHLEHLIKVAMLYIYPHSENPNANAFRGLSVGANAGADSERLRIGGQRSSVVGGGSSCDVLLELVAVAVQCLAPISGKWGVSLGNSMLEICAAFRAMQSQQATAVVPVPVSVLPACTVVLELINYCDSGIECELRRCILSCVENDVDGGGCGGLDYELLVRVCFKFLEAR